MEGYDSPEIHPSKNALYRDQEIIAGQQARNYLSSLCLHKILWLECDPKKNDKYGRLLGKLYNDDVRNPKRICINDIMLRDGYGYEYNGNKKMPFNPNQWKPRIQHKILDS